MPTVHIISWTENKDKGKDKTVYWILTSVGISELLSNQGTL